jgi:hypothetical protein
VCRRKIGREILDSSVVYGTIIRYKVHKNIAHSRSTDQVSRASQQSSGHFVRVGVSESGFCTIEMPVPGCEHLSRIYGSAVRHCMGLSLHLHRDRCYLFSERTSTCHLLCQIQADASTSIQNSPRSQPANSSDFLPSPTVRSELAAPHGIFTGSSHCSLAHLWPMNAVRWALLLISTPLCAATSPSSVTQRACH